MITAFSKWCKKKYWFAVFSNVETDLKVFSTSRDQWFHQKHLSSLKEADPIMERGRKRGGGSNSPAF